MPTQNQIYPIQDSGATRVSYNPPNYSRFAGETHELEVYLNGNIQLRTTQITTNLASEVHGTKPSSRPSRELRFWQPKGVLNKIKGFTLIPLRDALEINFLDENNQRVMINDRKTLKPLTLAYPERGQATRMPEQRF